MSQMSYELVDPIILKWAQKHTLHIYTQYKDEEVRSVDVTSTRGERFQIWIDPPVDTQVNVHAWDYKKIKKGWVGEISELESGLEEIYQTVKSWMHT